MLWPWRRSRDRDADLRGEIRNHLDLEAEDLERAGLTPDEARRHARLAFGNPAIVGEEVREAWGGAWLERVVYDIRHGVRLWRRSPGFSTIAVLTMALGVGASTAIFGQISAVFWKPLPVSEPDRLRLLAWTAPRYPYVIGGTLNVFSGPRLGDVETFGSFSYPAYVAMRDGTSAFSDLACWADLGESRPVTLGPLGVGAVQFVSGNFFRALGVPAALGRTIEPDDDRPGAWSPVAMIGYAFWQRVYGGDPNVTRQTLRLNGQPFAIVGVMPDGFFGMDSSVSPDVVIPIHAVPIAAATTKPLENPGLWNVCRVVGRLAPGVGDEQARLDVERWVEQAIVAHPPAEPFDPPRVWILDGSRGLDTLRDAASTPLAVLFGVVGGLLLAACANIGGLLLARGSARQKEMATRLALGAPRGRLVRQLVTESLVLASAGGAVGIILAYGLAGPASTLLSQFMPTLFGADRTIVVSTAPDARVLAFGTAVALLSGLLFGLSPALRTTRVDLIASIRQTSADPGAHRFGLTGGQAMVAAQAALAMLLLVGAGLFLRTVSNLRSADLGFPVEGLLYARVDPRAGGIPPEARMQFVEDAVERLAALPGVRAASAAASPPMIAEARVGATGLALPVCLADQIARGVEPPMVAVSPVAPRFFETIGVSVLQGRGFTWSDRPPAALTVIVNEAFVAANVPAGDAVGRSLGFGEDCTSARQFPIVGVAEDVGSTLRGGAVPTIYIPLGVAAGPTTLIVRTAGNASALVSTVRRAIGELNADAPTFGEATVVDLRERQLRRERVLLDLLMLFGTLTLLLCCLGLDGMLSYAVTRRRAEISIRMAIGARGSDVVRMVVGESLVPVGLGLIIGGLAALAARRWVDSLLFDVSATDPWTIAGAAALFLVVAAGAAVLPARRAMRVDPVQALRQI